MWTVCPRKARDYDACDHYLFVLSRAEIDGILCSPLQPAEVKQLAPERAAIHRRAGLHDSTGIDCACTGIDLRTVGLCHESLLLTTPK